MRYKNLRPTHSLTRWRYYEEAKEWLGEIELENAKVFFNALRRLSREEQEALADKYYRATRRTHYDSNKEIYVTVIAVKNGELAKKWGVNEYQAGKRIREATDHLKAEMEKLVQEQFEKLSRFKMAISHDLFLITDSGKGRYLVGDQREGRVFTIPGEEAEIRNLQRLGFKKWPIGDEVKILS